MQDFTLQIGQYIESVAGESTHTMKLKFKQQAFQTDAVNSIVDLFTGQEKDLATFSITQDIQMSLIQNDFGIGNALRIDESTLLSNMYAI